MRLLTYHQSNLLDPLLEIICSDFQVGKRLGYQVRSVDITEPGNVMAEQSGRIYLGLRSN